MIQHHEKVALRNKFNVSFREGQLLRKMPLFPPANLGAVDGEQLHHTSMRHGRSLLSEVTYRFALEACRIQRSDFRSLNSLYVCASSAATMKCKHTSLEPVYKMLIDYINIYKSYLLTCCWYWFYYSITVSHSPAGFYRRTRRPTPSISEDAGVALLSQGLLQEKRLAPCYRFIDSWLLKNLWIRWDFCPK